MNQSLTLKIKKNNFIINNDITSISINFLKDIEKQIKCELNKIYI